MSPLLDQAIEEVKKLSLAAQDAIAALILEEIADDRRWEESFARSPETLARLAEEAAEDVKAGRFREVGIDDL